MTTSDDSTHPPLGSPAAEVLSMLAALAQDVARVTADNLEATIFGVLHGVRTLAGLRHGHVLLTDSQFNDFYQLTVDSDPFRVVTTVTPGPDHDLPRERAPVARLDDQSPVTAHQQVVTRHVIAGGRKLGELCVVARDEAVWTAGDQADLLGSLAGLAAVALERCARQREAVDLGEWLDAFRRVFAASRTAGTEGQLADLRQEIADSALRLTKAGFVVLYEYFKELEDVCLPPTLAGHVREAEVLCSRGVAAAHKRSAVFRLVVQGLPFYAKAASRDWQAAGLLEGPGGQRSFFAREAVLSSAGIPLRVDTECVGVLFVNYRREFEFPEHFRAHLDLFASQAALAIGNARFFQRSQRYAADLLALNRIGSELCSSNRRDISDIGLLIYEKTQEVIPTKNFFVCMYRPAGERFSIPFQRDQTDSRPRVEEGEDALNRGLTGHVCRTGRSLLADRDDMLRLYDEGSAQLVGHPAAIWMGAPLLVRDQVIGALVVQDYEDETAFNQDHLKLLEAVASQAAIAIDNYHLFEQANRTAG